MSDAMKDTGWTTVPNPDQPDRCPSIDPHDTLQCGRRIHDDDQCQVGGIAWKKGSPRYVGADENLTRLRLRLARLRDEVIAVVAEGLWDGDSDRGQPDYDRIAALYDEAASSVIPLADKDTPAEREHRDGCMTEYTWDEDDCNCRPACSDTPPTGGAT